MNEILSNETIIKRGEILISIRFYSCSASLHLSILLIYGMLLNNMFILTIYKLLQIRGTFNIKF